MISQIFLSLSLSHPFPNLTLELRGHFVLHILGLLLALDLLLNSCRLTMCSCNPHNRPMR